MSDESGPYARLYLALVDDPKFATVYDDDHLFAAYCRLLMIAEGAWPASAHLPITAKRLAVRRLAAVELIDLQESGRYRVHGLDAERGRRSEKARVGAAARWMRPQSDRNATASGVALPAETSKDEQSKAETSSAPQALISDERDSLDRFYELSGYRPWGAWSGEALRTAELEYGMAAVIVALDAEAPKGDRGELVKRTLARLAREADQARRMAAAKPAASRPKVDRTAHNAELMKLYAVKPEQEAL